MGESCERELKKTYPIHAIANCEARTNYSKRTTWMRRVWLQHI